MSSTLPSESAASPLPFSEQISEAEKSKRSIGSWILGKVHIFTHTPFGWILWSASKKADFIFHEMQKSVMAEQSEQHQKHYIKLLTGAEKVIFASIKQQAGMVLSHDDVLAMVRNLEGWKTLEQEGGKIEENVFDSIYQVKKTGKRERITSLLSLYSLVEGQLEQAVSMKGNPAENFKTIIKNCLSNLPDKFAQWIGKNKANLDRIAIDAANHFQGKNFFLSLGVQGWNGKDNIFRFCEIHRIKNILLFSSGFASLKNKAPDEATFRSLAELFVQSIMQRRDKPVVETLQPFHLENPINQARILKDAIEYWYPRSP